MGHGPRVRGTRPYGKAPPWRIDQVPGAEASRPFTAGWCTPHAADVLRRRMRLQCPQRIPLGAAREAAVQVVRDPNARVDEVRSWAALRAANTALTNHYRTRHWAYRTM
jgi:hypothetical protein